MKSYTIYTLIISVALLFTVQLSAQQTALFDAVKSNNIKEVKLLLNKSANPNAYDDDSDNVLMNAALFASADSMKLLLQNKANPNLKNKYGETALMLCTSDLDKMKLYTRPITNIKIQPPQAPKFM